MWIPWKHTKMLEETQAISYILYNAFCDGVYIVVKFDNISSLLCFIWVQEGLEMYLKHTDAVAIYVRTQEYINKDDHVVTVQHIVGIS
jgi:hypothetical protein